jgi:hypothetical protein
MLLQYSEPPNGCFPLQQAVVGRGRVYVPLQLSDLKEIKKDLGRYIDAPEQYLQAFISVIQTIELSWKDSMHLLDHTFSSLEKQWVLPQDTHVGDDSHLQQAPIPMAPGNEGRNMPITTGAQAVLFSDAHWKQNGEED